MDMKGLVLACGLMAIGASHAAPPMTFSANLDGFNAGGAPVDTNARGQANFTVIDDGTAIAYRINVAGIENLWMAHIHVSAVPVDETDPAGPVAFWFVPTTPPAPPPPGASVAERLQGNMASGVIMMNGQLVGALAPDPADPENTGVAGLIKAMQEGRASVVVHTNAFGDPGFPAGASGNSPQGELRGTIH